MNLYSTWIIGGTELMPRHRFKREKITIDANGRKHGYRSGLENDIIQQLEELGYDPKYESVSYEYIVPESKHKYTPDFPLCDSIVIETKGLWKLEDRQKMLLLKEQHPDIDFRMVFYNANQKIKKGSKTTYAMWCEKHNIKWAHKKIPKEWLLEINDVLANENN